MESKKIEEVTVTPIIAQTLDDFYFTLNIKPLNADNYDNYYVDTKKGRGKDPIAQLAKRFTIQKHKNLKILLSGFRGCGKSTELYRLKRQLDDQFLIRIISVREKLDPNNLTVSEILLTVMRDLFDFVNSNHKQITLSDKLLENIERWADTIYSSEEIKYKYYEGSIKTGGGISAGFGKLLNIFARLGLDFNAGRKFQEITRKAVNQTLTELIMNCNLLLMEVKNQLHKVGKSNVIFIIEDLEKVALSIGEEIFFNYSKQLTSISCSFIYTFPISLVFNPKYNVIIQDFDVNLTLPMIKVHEKDGSPYQPGIDSILEIISKRIDAEKKLVSPKLLQKFVSMSGGCLRDLFRMLNSASENASGRDKGTIEEEDFQYALKHLKNDYYNTISYNEATQMTAEDYYKILVDCCNSRNKKPMDVKGLIDLKHNMCILGYNGDGWFDVHPVVKLILRDQGMIDSEK
ncbi:MAG: hypothetical protein GY765_16680 [bacterium]|nr:hypothetical protein [bacterium]